VLHNSAKTKEQQFLRFIQSLPSPEDDQFLVLVPHLGVEQAALEVIAVFYTDILEGREPSEGDLTGHITALQSIDTDGIAEALRRTLEAVRPRGRQSAAKKEQCRVIEEFYRAVQEGLPTNHWQFISTIESQEKETIKVIEQRLQALFRSDGNRKGSQALRDYFIVMDCLVHGMTQDAVASKYTTRSRQTGRDDIETALSPTQVGRIVRKWQKNDVVMGQLRLHYPDIG